MVQEPVATEDVQSLVLSGHARLPFGVLSWLQLVDPAAAKEPLRRIVEEHVGFSFPPRDRDRALQIALSAEGLRRVGAPPDEVAALGRPFDTGVATPHRSRALGDAGRSAPATWRWSDRDVHVLLLAYARTGEGAAALLEAVTSDLGASVREVHRLGVRLPRDGREPFGFRDGLRAVRPRLAPGGPAADATADYLPPGEVLLGHPNALGIREPVPALGRDGSFLVVRQIEQDVLGFWDFWRSRARDDQEAVWLASKAVGRWPNGMPVSGSAPGPEPPADPAVIAGPLSFADDPRGERCPLGAHIRRANPRDGMGVGPERSLARAAAHRLLRRGRVYGSPTPREWLPAGVPSAASGGPERPGGGDERGLVFACLVGDIARQFEFVQQTWLNKPGFGGLYDEVDALAAGRRIPGNRHVFTIPRTPLRRRVGGVRGWTTVRGGGYFLLPGRATLRAALASRPARPKGP